MKQLIIFLLLPLFILEAQIETTGLSANIKTFCNPVDISYRFCLDEPSRRETADPTVVWFRDRYYLFASKSGGYWHSKDLTEWIFIPTTEIPVEDYAPTAIVIDDTLFFLASSNEKSTIYKTIDPLSGKWIVAKEDLEIPVWDPAFFMDDDARLYLYWGCSNINPLYGVEVDYKNNFSFIGKPKELIYSKPDKHGWEVPGDFNTLINQKPWIEGPWMNKYKGKYYLQYSGPGSEYKSYSDGVYVSENPLGPFVCQPHNPFAYKPDGFISGAGHGSTFADKYGNYWHIGTITISQKHIFERRLGLFPVFFDEHGVFYSNTKYGDFPLIIPQKKVSNFDELFPGWMLLSYNKKVVVSSSIDSLPPSNMVDEDIRTYWAAKSGDAGEYAVIDLEKLYDVYALQINFAEHNTEIFGREKNTYHKYIIEYSEDSISWNVLIDKSNNETDNTHNYFQLSNKISCRYLKIKNICVPDGSFALSGFRVFGIGKGVLPTKVTRFAVERNSKDKRSIRLSWDKSDNTTGYNISFGTEENKLYNNYIVYDNKSVTINILNADQKYFFSIESFNESGVTTSDIIINTK
jgi:xylan 1,4-beta-xylosidase